MLAEWMDEHGLAGDLLDEKYRVEKIQPVDMFPHTLHIENVVQLKLKDQ